MLLNIVEMKGRLDIEMPSVLALEFGQVRELFWEMKHSWLCFCEITDIES